MRHRKALPFLAAGVASLATLGTGRAQDKREGPEEPTTIYVPYKNVDEIFNREKGGVFVPYQELLKLLDRASHHPTTTVDVGPAPPVPYVLVGAKYSGSADERVARFTATIDMEVLEKKGYVTIPLGLPDVALEEVTTADGKRAVIRAGANDYELVAHGAGPLSIKATFAAKVNEDPGKRSFAFRIPRAAMSTFECDLPERDLRVNVDGALAFSSRTTDENGGKTRLTAFLSNEGKATVTWWPRPKDVEGDRKPLLFAETTTGVRLEEGVARSHTTINYKISQAPADTFRVAFPAGWKLMRVSGDNMNEYSRPTNVDAKTQAFTVSLHSKMKDAYKLEVELERTVDENATEFAFPRVVTLDTEREQGTIAANPSSLLKLEAKTFPGLSQIDAKDIPAEGIVGATTPGNAPLGFKYLKNDFDLVLKVSKIEPEVEGRVLELVTVKDDELTVAVQVQYEVKRRGIFSVELALPPSFELVDYDEEAVKDRPRITPIANSQWQLCQIDFPRQVEGKYPLRLVGRVKRADASPKPDATETLALPIVALRGVKKETGVVAVASQDHLNVLGIKPQGLTSVAVQELPGNVLRFPFRAGQGEETRLAWKYTRVTEAQREPRVVASNIEIGKRTPKVTARIETLANAQENKVEVRSDVIYKIEFAGVDTFRLKVPAAIARENDKGALVITESDGRKSFARSIVKEVEGRFEPVPGDEKITTPEAVIELKFDKKISPGELRLKLSYEIPLDGLQPGLERTVALHDVVLLGLYESGEVGDIALAKNENLVISEQETSHVETRDVRELPDALKNEKGAFKAYRYQSHPVKLALRIIKYDFQPPLGTIVNHLHLEEVVDAEGPREVEAMIRLQNSQAQLLRIALPAGAAVKGLRVAEKNVRWLLDSGTDATKPPVLVVNLAEERVGQTGGPRPFLIRVRYRLNGDSMSGFGSTVLDAPTFPLGASADGKKLEVPVAIFTRRVYLPDTFAYLDFDSDMTPHFIRMSCWERLKDEVFTDYSREREGDVNANAAIDQTRAMISPQGDLTLVYPALETKNVAPKLFSKLDGHARLKIAYVRWPLFYVLDIAALIAIVAAGVALERRGRVRAATYASVAAAAMLLLAAFGGAALEPFFESGLIGATGLGVFWFCRATWRELTVERHKRRLEELAAEAQVAKARAAALEVEEHGTRPTEPPTPPAPEPKGPASAQDEYEAAKISMEEKKNDDAGEKK